jgi:hypothetical protein
LGWYSENSSGVVRKVAMLDAVASEIDLPSPVDDPRTDLVEAFPARVARSADSAEFPAVGAAPASTGRVDFRWGPEALITGIVPRLR